MFGQHNSVCCSCRTKGALVLACRWAPTTSGQHLLDKYVETHAGYDADAKTGAAPVTLEG